MYIHKTTINNKKARSLKESKENIWNGLEGEKWRRKLYKNNQNKRYIGLLKFPEWGEESLCIKSCNRRYFSTRVWVGRPRVSLSLGINWLVWC